jgi:hypothetical protein
VKLAARHTFPVSPERLWEIYWDPAFEDRLKQGSTVQRDVLEHRDEGNVVYRRVRITPQKELPAPAAAIVGTKKLVYEQETRFDKSKGIVQWQVVPSFLPDKLDAKGQLRVEPAPGGCAIVIDGTIDVKVRFVGGQIEKAVVAEVEKSYDRLATEIRRWIADHA